MVHESGWKSRILLENSLRVAGMSVMLGTSCRYSSLEVNRSTNPRRHPSTIASDIAQAADVAHTTSSNRRHGNLRANSGPHSTPATAMRTANGVPQPK